MRRYFVCLLLVFLMLFFQQNIAWANMANPWNAGDTVGEPIGVFRQLDIIQENLLFDLRSLTNSQLNLGQIVANYLINNQGEAANVDLLFISPGIKTGNVTIDGNNIPFQIINKPKIAPEWQKPINMPMLGEMMGFAQADANFTLYSQLETGFQFTANLPKGKHSIQVSYFVKPNEYNGSDIYREYLIGYLLTPARNWASFGKLDMEVKLPPGWEVKTSLEMQRHGDILQASFNGIPADFFGITTRPPIWFISSFMGAIARGGGWILGIFISIYLASKISQLSYKKPGCRKLVIFVPAVIVLVFIVGIIFTICGVSGEYLRGVILDNGHISSTWQYGENFILFLFMPLLGIPLGTLLTLFAALYFSKAKKPEIK